MDSKNNTIPCFFKFCLKLLSICIVALGVYSKSSAFLKTFKKLPNTVFKFVSSGEDRKSIRIAGSIKAYGEPLTIITTLPCKRALTALSGLSDTRIFGIPKTLVSVNNCSNSPAESKESISKLLSLYFASATKLSFFMSFI